jgi:predicted dehydrogenase
VNLALKLLVVGLGAAGQRHCRNLRTLLGEDAELMVLRSRRQSPALDEKLQPTYGIDPGQAFGAKTFIRLEDALAERPRAVIIANPSSLHLPIAMAAVRAGCAVFLEKPLSHSWDGIPELLSEVETQRLPSFVGYQWRFHPLMRWLKSHLETRPLGPLLAVRVIYGEYLPGWHPYEDYRASYAATRALGGGVLLTQIHEFDYLGWLLGWPREVYSLGGHLSSLEIDVEDVAMTLMKCPAADGQEIPVSVHQDYVQRAPVRQCEIIADRGKLVVDLLRATARAWDAGGTCVAEQEFGSFSRNEMFLAEMRHFLNCLDEREASLIPAKEGARSLAVALAALRSLRSGQPETVTYP